MKKYLTIALFVFTTSAIAQTEMNFERYLIAGDQSSEIIGDYFSPAIQGMSNISSTSWYNTAEVHSRFGFNLTVNATGAMVPSSSHVFDVSKYNNLIVQDNNTKLSTISGSDDYNYVIGASHSGLTYNDDLHNSSFKAPTGANLGDKTMVPSVMIQAGMGIGWGTEINVRYVPNIGTEDFSANLLGFAVKHDVSQYLPFEDKVPVYLSVLAGYTNMKGSWTLNADDSQWDGKDQITKFDVVSYTFQLIASTNIPIINFYGGVGYNIANSSYKMNGEYIVNYNEGPKIYTNPASKDYSNNNFNATIGTKLSLGFFEIFGDYSYRGEYNTVSVGLAISFN